ncbi:MAG: NAD(P)-binding domain-containing protein [Thermoplasmata archaeon]|nr:NAD(P)-binding domain-containing protein [Thermoplasmata archaeon]
MKVGIIGSGEVGQHLGIGFAATGHTVRIGSREPSHEKLTKWKASAGANASTGTFEEAARFGELVVVATLWSGTENALRLAGAGNFAGKVVIDSTNPLVFRENAPPGLALGHTDSGGEQVQRWLPNSHVVKAFNIVGNGDMFRPTFAGGPPDMFFCGNDAAAKKSVSGILQSFGWNAIDIGGIEGARVLESLCMLWVGYMFSTGSQHHALKMLHG